MILIFKGPYQGEDFDDCTPTSPPPADTGYRMIFLELPNRSWNDSQLDAFVMMILDHYPGAFYVGHTRSFDILRFKGTMYRSINPNSLVTHLRDHLLPAEAADSLRVDARFHRSKQLRLILYNEMKMVMLRLAKELREAKKTPGNKNRLESAKKAWDTQSDAFASAFLEFSDNDGNFTLGASPSP